AGTSGVPLILNGSASQAPAGDSIIQFTWDFGDGSAPMTGSIVQKTYITAGTLSAPLAAITDKRPSPPATTPAGNTAGQPRGGTAGGRDHPDRGDVSARPDTEWVRGIGVRYDDRGSCHSGLRADLGHRWRRAHPGVPRWDEPVRCPTHLRALRPHTRRCDRHA